ncbi:MAG: purine-nucleoside phosphorylase [Proteobacteria bacterium]|nr:purine-nucleoside phosphorylase [Pseudomonadota bacterium]MBU1738497.1 purine-nucleoside phosphorylase [Pseudomonadota bacterium]
MDDFAGYRERVDEGVRFLEGRLPFVPEYAIVLGTGLGSITGMIEEAQIIPYEDIPGFPGSTVVGHAGNLVCGKMVGVPVVALQGRHHYYEGYSTRELTIPIRVLSLLGIKNLVITNAAGGLRDDLCPGSIMVVKDHINLIGDNPLRGPNVDGWGERFPDMSKAYDEKLAKRCLDAAAELGMKNTCTGIYCAVPGPSLETPAETRYLKTLGVDAVGMSTVPEVIVARHAQMKVLALSVIANVNDPDNFQPIMVAEILEKMAAASSDVGRLLQRVVAG